MYCRLNCYWLSNHIHFQHQQSIASQYHNLNTSQVKWTGTLLSNHVLQQGGEIAVRHLDTQGATSHCNLPPLLCDCSTTSPFSLPPKHEPLPHHFTGDTVCVSTSFIATFWLSLWRCGSMCLALTHLTAPPLWGQTWLGWGQGSLSPLCTCSHVAHTMQHIKGHQESILL